MAPHLRLSLAAALLLPATASAGSGPWVIGDGEYSVYVGGEVQRLERLQTVGADGTRDTIDVDQGLSTLGGKVILTVGAQGRMEAELAVPWFRVQANQPGAVCDALDGGGALPFSSCATTQGVGIITARGKGTVLDELYGDPLTWAVGGELRFGHFTTEDRHRITNLGEGTFDVGAFTSVGRGGLLGEQGGYWTGFVEVAGWYRTPNTRDYTGIDGQTLAAPGPEFAVNSQVLFGTRPWFSIGPDALLYARPFGLDFGELDPTDEDRFAALRFMNVRVGATIVVRARDNINFSASALHTVAASNNPYTTVVSIGVSTNGRFQREIP